MPKYFRFHPTDAELIEHLKLKTQGKESELDRFIAEINVCKWEPSELPAKAKVKSDSKEWWFLCPLDYKCLKKSNQVKRSTKTGYWKKTGEERKTKGCVGMKRNLVFHRGRQRTDWVIHEYYYPQRHVKLQDQKPTWVICRLMHDPQRKGRNSDAPDFEEGEPSGDITCDLEKLVASFVSSVEHVHGEVNHQPVSQVPHGDTTSFPENPLAFADNNSWPSWNDGLSLSDLENPISSDMHPADHCDDKVNGQPLLPKEKTLHDDHVQALSGTADQSNKFYLEFLDPNVMEKIWSDLRDEEMQDPSGATDELNKCYEKLPVLCVVDPIEKDYNTSSLQHSSIRSYADGQFNSDILTEEVNEQARRHVYWPLDRESNC